MLFVQIPSSEQGSLSHSSMSSQVTPEPLYPRLHAHVNDPDVFAHAAFASQSDVPKLHSSTSVHVTPSPLQPALHLQLKDPALFVQDA
jgi:hypothetical protein